MSIYYVRGAECMVDNTTHATFGTCRTETPEVIKSKLPTSDSIIYFKRYAKFHFDRIADYVS